MDEEKELDTINVAILLKGKCVNVAVFETLSLAKEFLKNKAFPIGDSVVELQNGGNYGIGDYYIGGTWYKATESNIPGIIETPIPDPVPVEKEIVDRLEQVEATIDALSKATPDLSEVNDRIDQVETAVNSLGNIDMSFLDGLKEGLAND